MCGAGILIGNQQVPPLTGGYELAEFGIPVTITGFALLDRGFLYKHHYSKYLSDPKRSKMTY